MKSRLLACFLACVALATGLAASESAADQTWREIETIINTGLGDSKGLSRQAIMQWNEDRDQRLRAAYLAFYEGHPTDPRRWDAALALVQRAPRFIKGWAADVEQRGFAAAIIDQEAAAAWRKRVAALREEMARATDLPTRVRERLEAKPLFDEIGKLYPMLERQEAVDWAGLRTRIDAHLAKYPNEAAAAGVVSRYMGMYERAHTAAETVAEWRALTTNPVIRQSELVAKRLDVIERETAKPMEMAFTAADGREVDLAKLRGKVVLIDFWATWCGPCIAEMPNVRRVYAAYHDRGFEVIGISLENASLSPNDTPEQTAAKHAAARKKLLDFTAANRMPWPQHYDGRYWQNEIARGRFNINSVPSTFLLAPDGTVAVVNIRGPQLEPEVRRLLKL